MVKVKVGYYAKEKENLSCCNERMRFNLLVLEKQRASKVEGPDLRLARESTLGELRSVLFGGHQTLALASHLLSQGQITNVLTF